MAISEYKVVGGFYAPRRTPQLVDEVNAAIADGWQPYGTPMLRVTGFVDQPMVKGDSGTVTEYQVTTGYSLDKRTPVIGAIAGWNPLGDTLRLDSGYFLQAYVLGQPYADIDVNSLRPSTPFGRALLNLADAAALKALVPPIDQVFRASFTTAVGELPQYCVANNVTQAITFNAQQIPNTDLGTLNNATGVFTAARDIVGILALSSQVRRTTGGASAINWAFQVETSPDGIVWTPVTGSSRRINIRGGGDNNIFHSVNLTTAVNLPTGTRLRFTQASDSVASNVGLVALAAGIGQTTAAGFIFSLYTVT